MNDRTLWDVQIPRARITDPHTSHAAARSVRDVTERQLAVLSLFQSAGPMHDEALLRLYRVTAGLPEQSDSGIRTRRKELVDDGFLVDTGKTTLMNSGRSAVVWGIP